MRKIKFRAWDKRNKKVITKESFKEDSENFIEGISITGLFSLFENNEYRNSEDFILMQFTGLKDKNGKEIYEGDIVKCNYCDKDFGIVTWLKDNARFGLNWDVKSCANARHTSLGYWCEVIGNIYENPELLNEMHSTLKK